MNKRLSRLLAAFLVLCMLPATFITAFARGKGVFHDEVENQSLENAKGQYIPETITIDGKLNDTGWPESNFNYVDVNTGYWSVLEPAHSGLNYKYQMRADHSQFYLGASVALPEGISSATFTLLLKDSDKTEIDGYTHRLVVALENGTATVKEHDNINITLSISTDGHPVLAAEKHLIACESDGQNYTFELRNLLCDMGISDISKITYYVSVDVANGDKTESLYHPKYALDYGVKTPTFEYWPVDSDGKSGGNSIDTTFKNTVNDLPYEVKVDGKFDEAVWSTLTNYYIHDEEHYDYEQNGAANGYISAEGDKIYGTGVKTDNNNHYLNPNNNKGFNENYVSNDIETNRKHVRFKYELRVDANYLYGAVVAYVPDIVPYYDTENGKTVRVTTSPDLCIYFFDDKRADHPEGYEATEGEDSDEHDYINNGTNRDDGRYLPEAILQIRSMLSDYENDKRIFSTLGNVWPTSYENGNPYMFGWGGAYARPSDRNMEATRVERDGNLWNFEFKVDINAVPKDSNGDICFSVFVADRYAVLKSEQQRGAAFTGKLVDGSVPQEYLDNYPEREWAGNEALGNVITAATIQKAKDENLDVANKTDFTDGELDQAIWAALSGADNHVDGRERSGGSNTTYVDYNNYQFKNYAYKISADHEYLYGAMVLDKGWDANDIVKLWINRRKTNLEIKKAEYYDVDLGNYASYGGDPAIESIKVTGATAYTNGHTNSANALFDATYHSTAVPYSNNVFSAWQATNAGGKVQLDITLSELLASNKIEMYFSGAGEGETSVDGISRPSDVTVQYSVDGVNYSNADGKLETGQHYYDTYYESSGRYFDSHKYTYTFGVNKTIKVGADESEETVFVPEIIEARYIRLIIQTRGQFVWMSEIDIPVTEAYGKIYTAAIPLSGNGGGVYFGTTSICAANADDNKFNYVIKEIKDGDNAGQQVVEFSVSLESLGIEQDLAASDLDDLFAYYVTVAKTDNTAGLSGLAHPRNNTGRYPATSTNWLLDETFDGANLFTYGDMLGDIKIDGKLDEKYWIANGKDGVGEANQELAEYVKMIHVDGTNGTYKNESKQGNSLSFDYKIYAGESYLYGAAIIDETALPGDTPYSYLEWTEGFPSKPMTRFDIWIDNKQDEYTWTMEEDGKYMSKAATQMYYNDFCFENY